MPVAGVQWNHRFVVGRPRWAPLARTERSRRNGQNAPFVKRMIKSFWNTQTRTLARRAFGGFLPWERPRRDQPMVPEPEVRILSPRPPVEPTAARARRRVAPRSAPPARRSGPP